MTLLASFSNLRLGFPVLIMTVKAGVKADTRDLQLGTRWRAQGSRLFNRLWVHDKDNIAKFVRAETKLLRPFLVSQASSIDRSELHASNELKAILELALELDNMLMSSRALFLIYWVDDSQPSEKPQYYNEAAMEAVAYQKKLSPQLSVRFFASPFFYKVGNADGQNYDTRMLLAKAKAVCN